MSLSHRHRQVSTTLLALALVATLALLGPAPTSAVDSERTLTNGCRHGARGLPYCGAYLGMAYGANSDPTSLERSVGRLGVRRTYFRADQVDSAMRTARADLARGRLPWISFKLPLPWWRMARGDGDAWARGVARRLARLDGPVWVAFHHEPEYDGAVQNWRRLQQRIGPIVRKTAPNAAFTVIVTGWHQFYGSDEFALSRIWPRGIKVDVAGFDIYNSHGVVKNGSELDPTDMDGAYFRRIQSWARNNNVRWALGETGYTDKAAREDPNWIARTHRQLDARGGVAMAYFNTTLNSIAPWDLGTTIKRTAYRDAARGTPRLPLP
jgi:hypothetical protein